MQTSDTPFTSELRTSMGVPFQLRCLGRPRLISPWGEPVRFRVRKHLGLLVYLALEPRVQQRRERMADLLWPNVSPTDGRHSLATAISVLRGKLGRELVRGDRDHVELVGTGLSVDLDRLAAGNILGDEYLPALEIGGFLEDFDIPDAPEFMLWRERQRARWLPAVRDALVLLIDRCRRTGDFRRIEHLANCLLEIDELSEDGIRAKMEARAFDGDRVTALKIFQSWRSKLAEELDAAPSALIEGMAIRLRQRGWETTPVTNIPTVPTDQWRGRPFIGRAQEYETLYNAWESTLRQLPRHVLILGDSGVGKSTLLERVVTGAGLEGAAISRVQCYELEREIPYAAVNGLIEGLLERSGAASTPPEWLAELARTVPSVRRRFPGIPDSIESQGENARIRLTEAVQQLVTSVAEEHPVILVLDDIHLADDASLAVLHLIMRRIAEKRIMVLLAARPGEMRQSPHAVKLLEGHEHLRMNLVDLQPMRPAESEALLESLLQPASEQPSHTVRRALLNSAAGFPMVLEYLVKDWEANGERCLALSIGAMTEEPMSDKSTSRAYHLILARLVNTLDPVIRNVLNIASVLGSRLNDINYYSLADVSVGQAMMGLGKLADLRILRDGARGLEFSNELVRGEAYLGIPASIRKALHHNVANQLLKDELAGDTIPGLEIAWHLIRAGRAHEATSYLLKGGRQAIDRGAPHEAESALTTAMGHLKEPERTDALLLLGEALKEQGKWELTLSAVSRCQFGQDDSRWRKAELLSMEPKRRLGLINEHSADDLIHHLLSLASPHHDIVVRIGAITNAAYFLAYVRNDLLSLTLRTQLMSLPRKQLDDDDTLNLALAWALIEYHDGNISSAISRLTDVMTTLKAREIQNLSRVGLYTALANVQAASGDYDASIVNYCDAYAIADRLGNDPMCVNLAANLAMCLVRLGRYEEVISWFKRVDSFDCDPWFPPKTHLLHHTAAAQALLGRTEEASETSRILELHVQNIPQAPHKQSGALFLADCYLMLGRRAEALSCARKAIGPDPAGPLSSHSGGVYSRWLAILAHEDDPEKSSCPQLEELFASRQKLDRMDQTEVFAAWLWLKSQHTRLSTQELLSFRQELGKLPVGVADQLRRLNLLSFL